VRGAEVVSSAAGKQSTLPVRGMAGSLVPSRKAMNRIGPSFHEWADIRIVQDVQALVCLLIYAVDRSESSRPPALKAWLDSDVSHVLGKGRFLGWRPLDGVATCL